MSTDHPYPADYTVHYGDPYPTSYAADYGGQEPAGLYPGGYPGSNPEQ